MFYYRFFLKSRLYIYSNVVFNKQQDNVLFEFLKKYKANCCKIVFLNNKKLFTSVDSIKLIILFNSESSIS